jgi:DHA3 family macrolide efflux protein-like MFS transporter
MFYALKNKSVSLLWLGQALSSIGDEIFRVALIWMAVGLIGANSGYVAAGQCASLLFLSLVGGKWADHWRPLNTMITVDLVRGLIVLVPVIISLFMAPPLWIFLATAFIISGLGAFFDPALQTCLPSFAKDEKSLRGATGLMSTTMRLARVTGPTIIGLLSGIISTIHFFTLDSISFFFSAFCVNKLSRLHIPKVNEIKISKSSFLQSILSGYSAVRSKEGMSFVFIAKAITGGTWNLAFTLGLTLLVEQMTHHDVRAFGGVIAGYGIGNLAGALYFGNTHRPNTFKLMYSGYVWLGIGWILVISAPNIFLVMVSAAICGFGGPMNDLPFTDLIQASYPVSEMPKVFRFRMAVETGSTLVCTSLAPLLLKIVSVRSMIGICAGFAILMGSLGLIHKSSLTDKT